MRNLLIGLGILGIVGAVSACGGDDHANAIPSDPTRGGTGGKSSTGKSGDSNTPGDSGAGGAGSSELAPSVRVTAPSAATDPDADELVTGDEVTVTCLVKPSRADGAGPLDEGSVVLALLDAEGVEVEAKPGNPTTTADEYSNTFSLTDVPAGKLGFSCSAADEGEHRARDEIYSLLDKGPTISFTAPLQDSAHALTDLLDVEFTVEPTRLADKDEGAAVAAVKLQLGGVEIENLSESEVAGSPGRYHLQVNLADSALFKPAPNGPLPIVVTASNSRKTAVTAIKTQHASIDGAGPDIIIVNPVDKDVVGGKVTLEFTAADAIAGVDPKTVVVSLNKVAYPYDAKGDAWDFNINTSTFKFQFDSREIKTSKVQITVNITAKDLVGNAATAGVTASAILFLDNFPPSVDLDPLNVRSVNLDNECSKSFDPVGSSAENDLGKIALAGRFRALVWENTNYDPEIQIQHPAGTDPKTVRIFLGKNLAEPILIDKDHDGICDDVRDKESAESLGLGPLSPTGQPWYEQDDDVAPTAAALECVTKTSDAPDKLCLAESSDMWQVVGGFMGNEPGVYAASASSGLECTGIDWELGSLIGANDDGWICVVARAEDYVHNIGVSRPLRLCVDKPQPEGMPEITPACANSSVDAPSCTDNCTAPPRWGNVKILTL
jgi:hypothetical protein